jgi:hypothetical protein
VNIFNRIMMVLAILVVFVVATIGLVVPEQSLAVIKAGVDTTLHTMGRIRPEFILPFRALLILCAVLLDVLLIGLFVSEVRGPARHSVPVQKIGGGTVSVTIESLAERLRYHLDQLADVISVKAKVTPRGKGVDLELDVQTGADVNVPEKAEQVLQVARQVIEDKMGLKLARPPRVYIHAAPYPGVAVRPISGPPAPAAKMPLTPPPAPAEPSSPFHRTSGERE